MKIATRQSVPLFLDRQIEKTMDFQNLTFVIRLMYILFSGALPRRVCACSIPSTPCAGGAQEASTARPLGNHLPLKAGEERLPRLENPPLPPRVQPLRFGSVVQVWLSAVGYSLRCTPPASRAKGISSLFPSCLVLMCPVCTNSVLLVKTPYRFPSEKAILFCSIPFSF